METALLFLVPEADPIVAPYRDRYDLSARDGIPAHVTLLYPFLPADEVSTGIINRVARVLEDFRQFKVQFPRLSRFGDAVLFVEPDDPSAFVDMTSALVRAFPKCLPYGGQFEEVVPHLTVADDADLGKLSQIELELLPRLPINALAREVVLMQGAIGSRWEVLHRFVLDEA